MKGVRKEKAKLQKAYSTEEKGDITTHLTNNQKSQEYTINCFMPSKFKL